MANKPKNKPYNPPPVPRPEPEIQADVDVLLKRAGETQYKLFVYEQDLESINQALVNLNNEAFNRRKLDAEAAKPQEQKAAE